MMKLMMICLTLLMLVALTLAKDNSAPAPNFTGVATSGEKIDLSALKGKVVILDFWASWCGPCRIEFPFLVELYKGINKDKQQLEIIAINLDDHADNMEKFLAKLEEQPTFPILPDPKGALPKIYGVQGMPTTVFIDKKGEIRFQHTGFTDKERAKYVDEVNLLLQEK